ncbi:hypothetical protein AB1Y20_022850 [Prymnesium parvum]|uniref:Anaphase-promoting complex subunit 15 n=1 Tax=Prymnesium parvum TaxID=97485 RepID=A0AB34JFE6_PRYPA|mmetsp:Transcript_69563/g.122960  ORF Transcript_69563/g.122960 Transcript_69563/m.122960 type:complete len:116 (-) Transcript_69563:151-498(-)
MSARCLSIPPQLLPHTTDAIWFVGPVVDEDAQLTEQEEAYKAQLALWRHFNSDLPIVGLEGRPNPAVPNDDDPTVDPDEDDPEDEDDDGEEEMEDEQDETEEDFDGEATEPEYLY